MSLLSIIAFVTGVLGVWLTIKQNIYCWPAALISVVTSMLEFMNEKLYGDMALQLVYFVAGVYGWIYWQKNLKTEFRVTAIPSRNLLPLALLTIGQGILYYFLL